MDRDARDDGTLAGLPWASVLDPNANARALDELRERGLAAANQLIDRLARSVDAGRPTTDPADSDASCAESTADPATGCEQGTSTDTRDLDRLVERCVALLAGSRTGGVTATGVELTAPGVGPATTDVWLHNTSDHAVAGGRIRCTSLVSHDGLVLPSESVSFEPPCSPTMAASTSESVRIAVEIPAHLASTPAVLRGVLVVEGHPEVWLPVTVTTGRA